jgi:ABC-type hemin transport system ATPase subunit
MNFFISFFIDENFNEQIRSRHREGFSYGNFSDGEKQRIDLALLFTWRAVAQIKNSVNTNLLIIDELADSFLDQTTTENVIELINSDTFKKLNIFVVSHKGTIRDKFHNVIDFAQTQLSNPLSPQGG